MLWFTVDLIGSPTESECTSSIFVILKLKHAHLKFPVSGWSKRTSIHTYVRNVVTLVWGLLRLAPINMYIADNQHSQWFYSPWNVIRAHWLSLHCDVMSSSRSAQFTQMLTRYTCYSLVVQIGCHLALANWMQLANAACYTLNMFLLARYEANLVTSHAVSCSESEKQFILLLLLESILEGHSKDVCFQMLLATT